jgi:hypothetical protein
MKTLYLDCAAGIAGDMTVGALLDLGLPLELLKSGLHSLNLPAASYEISAEKASRLGIASTLFRVTAPDLGHHRHYADIVGIIASSRLPDPVKELSGRIFHCLAEAESRVHNLPLEQVHFHEVGAIDSIIDIVGTAIGLDYLEVGEIYSSPLPFGSGWIETAHGRLPVPAPATAELMKGRTVTHDPIPGEWVTPTGAAIVAALASPDRSMPQMGVTAIGYGAGTRDIKARPNLLRAVLGVISSGDRQVFVVETHLDDMNPEILGFLMERLFSEGALDVAFSPLQMKKNRPGTRLTLITEKSLLDRLCTLILNESTAIGVRRYPVERVVLERSTEDFSSSLGNIKVKRLLLPDGRSRIAPEFEECRRLALATGLPLLEVYKTIERESAGLS